MKKDLSIEQFSIVKSKMTQKIENTSYNFSITNETLKFVILFGQFKFKNNLSDIFPLTVWTWLVLISTEISELVDRSL